MNALSSKKLVAAIVALLTTLLLFSPIAEAGPKGGGKGGGGGGGGGEPPAAGPVIDLVQITSDTSATVTLLPYSGSADGFEIYSRPDSGASWTSEATMRSNGDVATLSLAAGEDYELAVRAYTGKRNRSYSDYGPSVLVHMNGTIANLAVDASGLASWTPYAGTQFKSYDFFRDDCWMHWEPEQLVSSVQVTECDGVPLVDGQTYTFGIRALQVSDDNPGGGTADVWTSKITATFTYSDGGGEPPPPPPPPPEAGELLQVAEVDGRWEIVDADNNPVLLNGVSIRRDGKGSQSAQFASSADLQAIKNRGFDTIRVVMHWNLFEPTQGNYMNPSFEQLDALMQHAESAGLNVILDPIHHVNSSYLPDWAWDNSGASPGTASEVMKVIADNAAPYLRYVVQRYADYQNVVAIDLVNEVREPSGDVLDVKMTQLMAFYHDLIVEVRSVDADKPIILQPYYGSTRVTGAQLQRLDDPTASDPNPNPNHFTNIIWSLHDYYSGNMPNYGDGYTQSGYTKFGWSDEHESKYGIQYGMLAYNSWNDSDQAYGFRACYPGLDANGECNPSAVGSRRGELRDGMRAHVDVHVAAAQQADMAMLIGEYGLPHAGEQFNVPGWSGGFGYLQDKYQVYNEADVSRIYWAFEQDIDDTYGLYKTDDSWHYWTPAIFGQLQN